MTGTVTTGASAEDIARQIADKSIDDRVCCREKFQCQTEAWRVALAFDIAAALRDAEARGAARPPISADAHQAAVELLRMFRQAWSQVEFLAEAEQVVERVRRGVLKEAEKAAGGQDADRRPVSPEAIAYVQGRRDAAKDVRALAPRKDR